MLQEISKSHLTAHRVSNQHMQARPLLELHHIVDEKRSVSDVGGEIVDMTSDSVSIAKQPRRKALAPPIHSPYVPSPIGEVPIGKDVPLYEFSATVEMDDRPESGSSVRTRPIRVPQLLPVRPSEVVDLPP